MTFGCDESPAVCIIPCRVALQQRSPPRFTGRRRDTAMRLMECLPLGKGNEGLNTGSRFYPDQNTQIGWKV